MGFGNQIPGLKQAAIKDVAPQGRSEPPPDPHLLLQGLPHLLDACAFDEVRQLKGGLLNASFALQVLALKTPVAWHRHRIPSGLEVDQELRVLCCHVMHLHNIGPSHELKNNNTPQESPNLFSLQLFISLSQKSHT